MYPPLNIKTTSINPVKRMPIFFTKPYIKNNNGTIKNNETRIKPLFLTPRKISNENILIKAITRGVIKSEKYLGPTLRGC